MEAKLAAQLPGLMSALRDPGSNTFPDLHVAVVSSSLGGGRFTDVPGCEAGGLGDQGGRFSHPAEAGLHPGDTFMRFNGGPINFSGDAGAVFGRLAGLGHAGCPYPQPLEAARRALTKAQAPNDPDNAGFLRSDAMLGVVRPAQPIRTEPPVPIAAQSSGGFVAAPPRHINCRPDSNSSRSMRAFRSRENGS